MKIMFKVNIMLTEAVLNQNNLPLKFLFKQILKYMFKMIKIEKCAF